MALSDGLVAAYDGINGSGGTLPDAIGASDFTLAGGAAFSGGALVCDADGEAAAVAPAPSALRLGGSGFSFAISLEVLGVPPNYASYIGCSYDAAFANPYWGWALIKNDSGNWELNINDAGTFYAVASSTAVAAGTHNLLAVVTPARRALYLNGSLIAEEVSARSMPNYATDALAGLGDVHGGRNMNGRIFAAYAWDQDKTSDAGAFNSEPNGESWAFGGGDPPMITEHYQRRLKRRRAA